MSDADRALVSRATRTPAGGVPAAAKSDQFTPVTDLLDVIEDPQLRRIVRLMWEHTANVELRAEQRIGSGIDISEHIEDDARMHREIAVALADIRGERGDNGKLGALKSRVDILTTRAWALVALVIGGVASMALKLVMVGRTFGELETEVAASKARIALLESVLLLRSLPAVEPVKGSP
jgi:hypothetical protein